MFPEEKKMYPTQTYRPHIEYMPARLTRGKSWYISFYAYDPETDALRRCRVKINRIKDKNERRTAAGWRLAAGSVYGAFICVAATAAFSVIWCRCGGVFLPLAALQCLWVGLCLRALAAAAVICVIWCRCGGWLSLEGDVVFRPVVVLAEAAGALWTVIDYKDSGACAAGEYSGLLVDAALVFLPFVLLHFPAVPVVADDGGGLLRQAH